VLTTPDASVHLAAGIVLAVQDSCVVFCPRDTRYELRLLTDGRYDGPVGVLVRGAIHAQARKVQTISAGGCFIEPISGPPRIVQGRVIRLDDSSMLVRAGAPIVIHLPREDHAFSLSRGPLAVGAMVNVTLLPGARFEPARACAAEPSQAAVPATPRT